jgi:hypothetical protein
MPTLNMSAFRCKAVINDALQWFRRKTTFEDHRRFGRAARPVQLQATVELPTLEHKLPRETRGRAYPLRTPLTEKNFLDDPT